MELKDTIELMISSDYKDRFKAEYYQNKIRYDKLLKMTNEWDRGIINFKPTCHRSVYDEQLTHMEKYLSTLKYRASIENIDLEDI